VVNIAALAACSIAFCIRIGVFEFDYEDTTQSRDFIDYLQLSTLLCASASAIIYTFFLFSWVYSDHSFTGWQPLGDLSIQPLGDLSIKVGIVLAAYASLGGLFARGVERVLITSSSASVFFLWALAALASAAA
jgi:hypothetical protein